MSTEECCLQPSKTLSLPQEETIRENYNQSEYRVVKISMKVASIKAATSKVQGTFWKGGGKNVRAIEL